jgi:HEAT repeat protein
MRSSKLWIAVVCVAGVVLGAGLLAPSLRAWYLLSGLSTADASSREGWAKAVAVLGESAVGPLLDGLDASDNEAENAIAGLDVLVDTGVVPAPVLVERLARSLGRLRPEGRSRATFLVARWLGEHPDEALQTAAWEMLSTCAAMEETHLEASLSLAIAVLNRACSAEVVTLGRTLAQKGLKDPSPGVRVRAVTLCMQPTVDLLDSVVPLLRDPEAEVRRSAVVALGPVPQAVTEEQLLLCLHDTDAMVQEMAHSALVARGLQPEQVELGRLLTHSSVRTRLRVLDRLPEVPDLDPQVWLRRLSEDPSPAVRAAAARALARVPAADRSDRLEEMARNDSSATVAWIARYYLAQRARLRPVAAP